MKSNSFVFNKRYLKTYELYSTGQIIEYGVGDIVVCVDDVIKNLKSFKHNPLINGNKYKVIQIYKLAEDIFLNNDFLRVDVENLETGEISKGWESIRFKLEMEFDSDKYNL
jgi:hypothetical protein